MCMIERDNNMSRKLTTEKIEEPGTALTTASPERTLTDAQETALAALLGGTTVNDAADAAGVVRETVSRWINHDPVFVAKWNRRRRDIWDSRIERLRGLTDRAVDSLEELLDSDNEGVRLRAATALLKTIAVEVGEPTGATDPEEVAAGWERDGMLSDLVKSFSAG